MDGFEYIIQAVINGDADETNAAVQQAIDGGMSALEVINKGIVAGLDEVGQKFESGLLFIPDMLLSAAAANEGIETASKYLKPDENKPKATMVIGTVKGDVHDIGKNLVALVLSSRGINVIDLGVNIHEEEFVAAVREYQPEFLGMSALLTTTMQNMKSTIEALEQEKLRSGVKILVGGACITQEFASAIGADTYAKDVNEAGVIISKFLAAN